MPPQPVADLLQPGTKLGKYELVHRLAFGGMAEIYLARATGIEGFQKYVVLKRILPQFATNEKFVQMFLSEARIAATLDHPNIAQVYDIGEQDGIYFFTMEYLHGETVLALLKEHARQEKRLPYDYTVAIGIAVAAGLHFAHEKRGFDGLPLGLVHRDVSPSNVFVTFSGGVKLLDFGIAKVSRDARELTGSGLTKGKIAYMSPEQCTGQSIDRRSDIFSLGVVLYEMSTQKRMVRAETELELVQKIVYTDARPPSSRVEGFPKELEGILMKALARDPDKRYQNARDLQIDLENFARENKLVTSAAGLAECLESAFGRRLEPWHTIPRLRVPGSSTPAPSMNLIRRRRRRLYASLGGVAVAGAIAAAFTLGFQNKGSSTTVVIENEDLRETDAAAVALAPTPDAAVAALVPRPDAAVVALAPKPDAGARKPDPPAVALRRAFARRQTQVQECLKKHAAGIEGSPQISVRFSIDEKGKVTSAALEPPSLTATPLGGCLLDVARGVEFPPIGPLGFSIPVSIRRRDP